jgi:hypothetical protein
MKVRMAGEGRRRRRDADRGQAPMFLSDVSIRRPVFATMMMVTLVVLGILGYQRLAVDEYPTSPTPWWWRRPPTPAHLPR